MCRTLSEECMVGWKPEDPVLPLPLPRAAGDRVFAVWTPVPQSVATDAMPQIADLPLVDPDEAATFKIPKRAYEHAAGRHALATLLADLAFDVSNLAVVRDEHRRPSLVWANQPEGESRDLPEITLGHSNGFAIAAVAMDGQPIGLDGEPLDLERPRNLLTFMVSGEEYAYLDRLWEIDDWVGMQETTRTWVVKEAVQKACGLGMHVAPQSFSVMDQEDVHVKHNGIEHRLESHHWRHMLDGRPFAFGFARLLESTPLRH